MKRNDVNETALFYAGWAMLGLAAMIWFIYTVDPFPIAGRLFRLPCLLHSVTGLYCPGCGGTRAVLALLRGDFYQSFVYHPFVIYCAAVGGWFMLSQFIERVSRHHIRIGLKYRNIYLWIALCIVMLNFLIKNVMLLMGVDLLRLF